uniref:Ig-like domain-containing protein n=1 Tax=Sinocyclocheilus grahami TaxID=75366 RepID=A0A672Q6S5_SINGR
PGSAPEFLMLILHSTGKVSQMSEIVDRDPRFSGKVNEEKTHVDLEISSAKLTDSCSYDTSSSFVSLYWYRQFSNTQPEYILRKGGRSETYENIPDPHRFGSTTSQKSTSLTIKSVTLSDSALYYCALRVAAQCFKVPERLYKNSLRKLALNSELSNAYQTTFVSS